MEIQPNNLYEKRFEHDACGIGAVVNIEGKKSYNVLDNALKIVEKLEHRAGKDATGETGDGVGILVQISHKFFSKVMKKQGVCLDKERSYGIGMFNFSQNQLKRQQAKKLFEVILKKNNLKFLAWRDVPTNKEVLGQKALDCMPNIVQCFIEKPAEVKAGFDFDRLLYVVRKEFEHSVENTYVVSLSSRTIVYKGMFLVEQLRSFYIDLQDTDYETAIGMVHSRFSTNTNPSWERAHPNRFILHNGEINTIRGNVDRMNAREETMSSDLLNLYSNQILPVVDESGSDSSMLDNTIEFLYMNGLDLPLAMMITIPEPWRKDKFIEQNKKDFYHYYDTMLEPWDGPASLLFSDGDKMGAILDRNGLRPSRYYVLDDNTLILSSEVGVLDIEPSKIIKKSRLKPGKILLVDTIQKRIISDRECKEYYSSRQPYGEWLDQHLVRLSDIPIPNKKIPTHTQSDRDRLYKVFGYSYADVKSAIYSMAKEGVEKTTSMGIDIPLAVLSEKHQQLFYYFKQLFAQVTNPPIDSLREEIVTDTTVYVGSDGNLLEENDSNCGVLEIKNPILTGVDIIKIKSLHQKGLNTSTVSLLYYCNTSLEKAVEQLFLKVDSAYRKGANIIILSDRGIDENHVAVPSLLAVSAIEQYLIRTKRRTQVSIILESGEPRDVHQLATLLGYGARAVNPYLAHECIAEMIDKGILDKDYHTAIRDYNHAVIHGIVKIGAKMGISCIQSYQSAQIFEAVGLCSDLVDKYFTNTISRVGGIGLKEIAEGVMYRHSHAFDPLGLGIDGTVDSVGMDILRKGEDKEDHLYSPEVIIALQQATRNGDYARFKEYSDFVNNETKPHTLRGLLAFQYADKSIPIDEVESVDSIVKRFKTGAMSYGSISQEAHECMAIAMNSIGAKSNSGEGGEMKERLGTNKNSAIKQVASARFGVTSEYLLSANEIQIKMAQGAKPGEGGHLPGAKVYPWIAKTRYSTPGVSLISPPPHHDIYSIEDLAQLIYDLKNANKNARISVKLVSEAGVGTIASGVAKAGAEVVLISGFDGGTGAAPQTSIHHAGLPWELGIAEAHQTLIQNNLRSRVVLEADGKLMNGRDVVIACLLGAEEFGFATAPLVSMGCMMMRVCNLDTCPVGIATQNECLRKRFKGKPEYVVNFMKFVAQEMREIMAKLGLRTISEMVGRVDLLDYKEVQVTKRAQSVDMSRVINKEYAQVENRHFVKEDVFDFALEKTKDESILLKKFAKSLANKTKHTENIDIESTDRTFGTIFGAEITKKYGESLADDTFVIKCKGGAGQSFGAFIPKGLTLELEGDANDYLGKGLSGGKIIVCPPKKRSFVAEENIIIGNVALYGATNGEAYINGIAGERFCVRNSGAIAVVEGVGNHGLEYMTGGRVVVLGDVGKNFGAGMSGGVAYVLDEEHNLYRKLNKTLVNMSDIDSDSREEELKSLIKRHYDATKSDKAKKILDNFSDYLPKFKMIIPNNYKKMMNLIASYQKKGADYDSAVMKAFQVIQKGQV